MRPPIRALAAAAAVTTLVLGACGNERTQPPDIAAPGPPLGHTEASFPEAGIRFIAPVGWNTRAGGGVLVATVQTGKATVAIWRYPRTEQLPNDLEALRRARRELIAAAKRRDKTFKVGSSRILRLRGKPAIQLVGRENIGGGRRRVRSTHIFSNGAEIVVDAYAPPRYFPRVDRTVFKPLLRSLRIGKPRPKKKARPKKRKAGTTN